VSTGRNIAISELPPWAQPPARSAKKGPLQ
jgi:hypothetical protein